MLVIKDIYDLKKYLGTRRAMAANQEATADRKVGTHAAGMVYAFDEAIKAVQALIDKQHSEKEG